MPAHIQIEDIVTYNVLKYNYDGNLTVLNYFESRFPYFIQNTYEDIMHYFEYSRDYHKKNKYDSEKVDHGILGGTLVFDRIIKKSKGSKLDLLQLKMACITICQHNIFKSQNASADNLYIKHNLEYLCHDQNYFITEKTPLLLFLSLIDTIECVKKFNKGIADKYFQTKTILQMIKVEISEKSLSIDFSELKRNSQKKGKNFYNKTYVKYWDVINTISQWTQFDTANYEDKLTITMRPLQIVTFDEYEIV